MPAIPRATRGLLFGHRPTDTAWAAPLWSDLTANRHFGRRRPAPCCGGPSRPPTAHPRTGLWEHQPDCPTGR